MTIQAVTSLNWTTYNGSPNNLIAQYAIDFGVADTWSFQPNGNVKGSVNQLETNVTATGVVIDNTSSQYPVTVSVGVTFIENIPPYSKGVVQLGGTSPYVKIQGQSSCLATFFVGVFPGSFVGQNVVASTMAAIGAYLPSGIMMEWGGLVGTIPAGWLYCNGAAVSRVTYAALFNAIGTTYGAGDGASTFNLPDRRGRFPRGFDDGAGRDPNRVLGSVQADNIASHQLALPIYMDGAHYEFIVDANGNPVFGITVDQLRGTTQIQNYAVNPGSPAAFAYSGSKIYNQGADGTETRPKNVTAVYMIKS